ncbi:MAG: hypothetical protein WA172_19885 [Terriglobales bacterium]
MGRTDRGVVGGTPDYGNNVRTSRATPSSVYASAMYSKQLITNGAAVIIMSAVVLRQVVTSIT